MPDTLSTATEDDDWGDCTTASEGDGVPTFPRGPLSVFQSRNAFECLWRRTRHMVNTAAPASTTPPAIDNPTAKLTVVFPFPIIELP
jgi:hypothetical protein